MSASDRPALHNRAYRLFAGWVLFCAFCSAAGWVLSAIHFLNKTGYLLAAAPFALAFWKWGLLRLPTASAMTRLRRRFRRPFAFAFLVLAAMAITGGILHAPNNFDALNYRIPRVFQWLAEERWYWIHTDFGRLNSRGCAMEWVTAPLILFTGSDRSIFLVNVVCFLFLPGRVFAVLTRLGVSTRTSYFWMWIFPAGYGLALQAGSVASDLFSVVIVLAAFEFALRARQSKDTWALGLSFLACGLMTAAKAFNLLLVPAWGLAMLPSLPLIWRHRALSLSFGAAALLVSTLPTALLNIHYCGDWTGLRAEPVAFGLGPPLLHVVINIILATLFNLAPPVFPFAVGWHALMARVIPPHLTELLNKFFEPAAAGLWIGELPIEETAGMGLGVSALLLMILLAQGARRSRMPRTNGSTVNTLISWAAGAGVIVIFARSGLEHIGRYLLPFYIFLIAPVLRLPRAQQITRQRLWKYCAMVPFVFAAFLLVVTPARPLWPAHAILGNSQNQKSSALRRAAIVYEVYRDRADVFAPLTKQLPKGTSVVGFLAINDPEAPLWKPFGSRRILHIRKTDSPEDLRARGITYIVTNGDALSFGFHMTQEEWLREYRAEVFGTARLRLLARGDESFWLLIRLR